MVIEIVLGRFTSDMIAYACLYYGSNPQGLFVGTRSRLCEAWVARVVEWVKSAGVTASWVTLHRPPPETKILAPMVFVPSSIRTVADSFVPLKNGGETSGPGSHDANIDRLTLHRIHALLG